MLMEGFHRKQLGNCIWRCFDLWDTGVIKLIPIYNSCELKICSIKYEFSRGIYHTWRLYNEVLYHCRKT